MYGETPCDKCGGPTLDFASGSIWCPDEDAHPGGHFVKRVAFERPPNRDHVTRPLHDRPTAASRGAVAGSRAFKPRAIKPQPEAETWAPSTHDFAETK
jgi:hypothetical protein